MDTRENQYIDNLIAHIDAIPALMPCDLARLIPLYIKAINDHSIVHTVSIAYIDNYTGKSLYKRFKKQFDQMHEMFSRNGIGEVDKRFVFKQVSNRLVRIPTNAKEMNFLSRVVVEETQKLKKFRKTHELRDNLLSKFKFAIKKYLHLTYTLGFNEPSECVKQLAKQHKIHKYIMSGDFSVILLPFLPEVESIIKDEYEHYSDMELWESLKGRYFNHTREFSILALEIKSIFTRNIGNFSDYFDKMYTDTYYKLVLGRKKTNGTN